MRTLLLLGFSCALLLAAGQAWAEDRPPEWAYPVNPPDFKLSPDDGKPRQVPDSSATYSVAQTRDRFLAPDWHPADHRPMPAIVAAGRKPDVFACGFCHRADGPGGPENASLAGLSADYIKQQMADFKNGLRKTSVPERGPPQSMIALAKAATDQEIGASAEYFSALKPRSTIKVVETDTVPKTYVAGWFLADAKGGEREPIGNRIIEVPEDLAQFENRDARSRFIAYVPVGSIQKGKDLAAKGVGGGGTQCAGCHGPTLGGVGGIPAIAGRSPSYAVRQFYDFKSGARAGAGSELMKPVVEKMTLEQMVALAAYAASLPPDGVSANK
jgi:cytochrome c553